MKAIILILFTLIFNPFLVKADNLKCGDQEIENCKVCGQGEASDSCATCQAEHFPVLDNLLCLSCEDPIYGQVGCKGECDGKDYSNSGFAYCQECKEGYYNLEGLCYKCEVGSPGCILCSNEKETGTQNEKFKCKKCLNENEYRINEDFRCQKCNELLPNCNKCHFSGEKPICDECYDRYFINSEKKCSSCYYTSISGGECLICSDDMKPDFCTCDVGYALNGTNCIRCEDDYCLQCELDEETDSTKCVKCFSGYNFNSEDKCAYCGVGCSYCYSDKDDNLICLACYLDNFLHIDNKCCPAGCQECEYDFNQKEIICTRCYDFFSFGPEKKECNYCNSLIDPGYGCRTCDYNYSSQKYECKSCGYNYRFNYYHYDYAYVHNIFQCLSNTQPENIGLYGCLKAEYIPSSDKYECLKCKNYMDYHFIPVITDKSCIEPLQVGLSNECIEAEKIGEHYSCIKCSTNYALVLDTSSNIKQCYERDNSLSYCLEGKKEDNNLICTKCVNNSALKDNICSCNSDSFSKDKKMCYKCNDFNQGNPGCDISKGCEYFSANDRLDCKKCKDGYFEFTTGQCFLCSTQISNCNKCHYDIAIEKLICDSCLDSYYLSNPKENECQLNKCEEYPEISPGCIICKDKLNEYKPNSKCQRCKYGYFKTKDEKCVYCRSEKYGGLSCDECGYEINENGVETDNIVCKGCYPNYSIFSINDYYSHEYIKNYYDSFSFYYYYSNIYYYDYHYNNIFPNISYNSTILSPKGKCYDCKILFSEACLQCDFMKNTNKIEDLKCTLCSAGYYLTPEGNCANFTGLINKIPNCYNFKIWIGNLEFQIYNYGYNYEDYYLYWVDEINMYDYNNEISEMISPGKEILNSKCLYCNNGYFINQNGDCEKLDYDKCSFISIIKNLNQLKYSCSVFCYNDNTNIIIRLKIKAKSKLGIDEFYLDHWNDRYIDFINNFGESSKINSCLNNSGEGGEYAPENLKNCKEAYYFPENNTYDCIRCISNYYLTNDSHLCYENNQVNINPSGSYGNEELGSDITNWYYDYYTLVTNENNEKEFIYPGGDLTGCLEAKANTTYAFSKYDCTNCTFMYYPYYSKYFGRKICQKIKGKIIKEYAISYELYNNVKDKTNAVNGICERDYLFTPNGTYCYKCDNSIVGMPGCKGSCNFSIKRDKPLICEGQCKTGYIESSEGVCSKCSSVNKGCYECHYENDYPVGYEGIKRQRRFVCDYCEEGYFKSSLGECMDCNNLGLKNCDKCEMDPNNNGSYSCTQCSGNYFLNEQGKCDICDEYHFEGIINKKCINCDNTLEGGVDRCLFCESDGEKAVCQLCVPGYILLTNNNSCLERVKNKELQYFENCDVLTIVDDKLVCSQCKQEYSLVQRNNIKECTYIPTLYDINFERNYENHFYNIKKEEMTYIDFVQFKDNDYIYKRYKEYFPCQEAENLGTEDNPLYSCIKCYDQFHDKKFNNYKIPIKITEENSKISYCINSRNHEELKDCTEATYQIKDGKEIYNCTECSKNYVLTLNRLNKAYYCQSSNATTSCIVLYCKTCDPNDGYVCNECLPDYEKDALTGSCVKKTEVVPAVIWKDIYRLNMNGEKVINNKLIQGPSLIMRGITSSQINSRHAFLIYLTFQIKHLMRNLEEEESIRMPAICEVLEEVEETRDDVNMVEYECIGNQTDDMDLANYKLDNIEEGNNSNSLKKSNLNELVAEIKIKIGDLENLENVLESSFTFEDLMKIVIFQMTDEIDSIKANKFKFNFQINGKLNKEITQEEIIINREFELAEVDTRANCNFRIGLNKIADLSCDLNVQDHKDIKTFSFKTAQINTDTNEIYLSKFSDIVLINSEEEEKDDNDKTIIIIISVVCGVVGAALIGVGIFFLVRKIKSAKQVSATVINVREDNNQNVQTNNIMNKEEVVPSGERIIPFGNK